MGFQDTFNSTLASNGGLGGNFDLFGPNLGHAASGGLLGLQQDNALAPQVFGGGAAQPPAGGGGLLDTITQGLNGSRNQLLGIGLGLLSGDRETGFQNAMAGAMSGARLDQAAQVGRAKTAKEAQDLAGRQALAKKLGLDPEVAANEAVFNSAAASRLKPAEAEKPRYFQQGRDILKMGPDGAVSYAFKGEKRGELDDTLDAAGVTDPKERQQAYRQHVFKPAPRTEFDREADAAGVADPAERQKLARDKYFPDKAASKDKALPAEMAGRFGMADEFFRRYPNVEKGIKDGKMTSPIDATNAYLGRGEQGAMRDDLRLGSDALFRLQTGAGSSEAEAKRQASQYEPEYTDTAERLGDKTSRLRDAVRSSQRSALKGRMSDETIERDYPLFQGAGQNAYTPRQAGPPPGSRSEAAAQSITMPPGSSNAAAVAAANAMRPAPGTRAGTISEGAIADGPNGPMVRRNGRWEKL